MRGSVIRPPKPCTDTCRECSYHCVSKPAPLPTVAQALERWFSGLPDPPDRSESLPLSDAMGRIAARPVHAPMAVPAEACATHDGIAISFETGRARLAAGTGRLSHGEFLRCPMGAYVPEEFDTVAHAEQCRIHPDGTAELFSLPVQYQSLRLPGSYIQPGEVLVREGERLSPSHLALMQYAGLTHVEVRPRPRVAILPTGNDLLPPGSRPGPGQCIDCDSIYIQTMTQQHGGLAQLCPILPDREEDIEAAVRRALPGCDLLVVIGGVSRDEHNYGDYTAGVLRRMGQIDCHGVRLSPGGKHLMLGQIHGKPVIGMPGRPTRPSL